MSRNSALRCIDRAFNGAMPPVGQDLVERGALESSADADDALRVMLRLKSMREEKKSEFEEVEARLKEKKSEFLDTIDGTIHNLDKMLKSFATPRLEGRHFDLPSGRMQFTMREGIATKPLAKGEDAQGRLKTLQEKNPGVVRVKLELDKDAAKAAIKKASKEGKSVDLDGWVSLAGRSSVKYVSGSDDKNSEPGREEAVPAGKEFTFVDEAANISPEAREMMLKEPPKSLQEAAQIMPVPEPAPQGIDLSKTPRIFQAPTDEHFDNAEVLESKRSTFTEMSIENLLEGQDRVQLKHVSDMPIDKIKSGFMQYMGKIGLDKADIKRWVAYQVGERHENVDSSIIPDGVWRRLLALAVHASVVMEKHSGE